MTRAGGAAACEFTGRWFGEGGIARPNRGIRGGLPLFPGIGGLSNGAGDAMSA